MEGYIADMEKGKRLKMLGDMEGCCRSDREISEVKKDGGGSTHVGDYMEEVHGRKTQKCRP